MNEDSSVAAPDFQGALLEEFGLTPEPDTATPQAPTPETGSESNKGEAEPAPTAVTEEPVSPAKVEPEAPQGADTKPEVKTEDAPEAPKYATKDDVLDAMREYNEQTTGRVNQVHEVRNEIIEKLHPQGIDTNIYDSTGEVVKTAQDIVDRGLIKENGEPFTYDEAASFMLQAQQQMAKNVEELNNWADNIAEQNVSLIEQNTRVMDKWGDVLKAMPETAQKLATLYVEKQLEFDKTNSYITKMSMTPEEFYDTTLAPYVQFANMMAQQEAQASQQQTERAQSEQAERNGLPSQRGQSEMKSNTGNPMIDALIDEMNKG